MKKKFLLAVILGLACASVFAQYVQTKKDADGWRILVDNRPFEVKGVVWSYTPVGETYSYDLWSKSDEYITRMIDTDMALIKAMGANTIRCFSTIPPKWIEYIYAKYGIYTIVNDLLGRYGATVNGKWYPTTDYSDKYTRDALVAQAKKTAETYRGTKGVLMYMFGNESNYGLVWSGSNIENLPAGEQSGVKAGYLYSLLEEAMAACKDIDPLRPVGFVNGDTQYLDIIAQVCPSLDILGINAYRGARFYDSFYESVADALDKPIVLTEAGGDAFNALLGQEDQRSQAGYLLTQWEEMYGQAYGKGRSANIVGGCVFEWVDEWWKHYQNKDLDVHNGTGTWSNAGYEADYRTGVDNMNEEWFGIVAQSKLTDSGINKRLPRAAYFLLADIWKLSLYDSTTDEVAAAFARLDPALYLSMGNEITVKESINEMKAVSIDSVDLTVGAMAGIDHDNLEALNDADFSMKQGFDFKPFAETTVGIGVKPVENLSASVALRAWTAPKQTMFDDIYPYYQWNAKTESCEQNAMIHSASFNYEADAYSLNGYYHVGHSNFETTGDFFNISQEAFDIIGYDSWGSEAPIAMELVGKGSLSGLTVIGGPEIWGGAKPQVLANWYRAFPARSALFPEMSVGLVYAEEFGPSDTAAVEPKNAYGPGRKASVYGTARLYPFATLKVGALHAGSEKVGATYYDADNNKKKVTDLDTIGATAEIGTEMFQYTYLYGRYIYRGLVADTYGQKIRGSFITGDSGSGNRHEVQAGADFAFRNFAFKPVMRARVPLVAENGRSLVAAYPSPFAVYWNRQAIEFEAVLTYDQEGATWFHDWNIDDTEGSKFAASLSALYTLYAGPTDKTVYKNGTGTWASFDTGLPAQRNLWQVGGKVISSPISDLKLIGSAKMGHLGSTGQDTGVVDFWGATAEARWRNWMVSGSYERDAFGPEDWYRNFNITYPAQWTIDLGYGFGTPSFLEATNRVGVTWQGKTFGETDPYGAVAKPIEDKSYSELTVYFNIRL